MSIMLGITIFISCNPEEFPTISSVCVSVIQKVLYQECSCQRARQSGSERVKDPSSSTGRTWLASDKPTDYFAMDRGGPEVLRNQISHELLWKFEIQGLRAFSNYS